MCSADTLLCSKNPFQQRRQCPVHGVWSTCTFYLVSKMHQDANNSASILLRIKRISFFFEENGKRFAVIFIRRRKKIKRYKHTYNPTQLKLFQPTDNCKKKENKELLVKKDQKILAKPLSNETTQQPGDGQELLLRPVAAWWRWMSFLIRYATSTTSFDSCWKIRRLRSFQIFHQKYIMRPSKAGFCSLLKTFRHFFHHQ